VPCDAAISKLDATDNSEYIKWFRARVLDVTGVDLAAPSDDPPPAVLIDYRA
jgi:hypothetical protein